MTMIGNTPAECSTTRAGSSTARRRTHSSIALMFDESSPRLRWEMSPESTGSIPSGQQRGLVTQGAHRNSMRSTKRMRTSLNSQGSHT